MPVVKISSREVGAEVRRRNAGLIRSIQYGIRAGAQRGMTHLKRITPKDEGQLKAAWRLVVWDNKDVSLLNDAPYAGVMEAGARAHPVSDEGRRAIEEWAQRHLKRKDTRKRKPRAKKEADPSAAAKAPKGQTEKGVSEEAKAMANAIIWRIRTQGYPGKKSPIPLYWARESVPQLSKFVKEETEKRIIKMADRKAPRWAPTGKHK